MGMYQYDSDELESMISNIFAAIRKYAILFISLQTNKFGKSFKRKDTIFNSMARNIISRTKRLDGLRPSYDYTTAKK